jgi:hypothetical protein
MVNLRNRLMKLERQRESALDAEIAALLVQLYGTTDPDPAVLWALMENPSERLEKKNCKN